MNSLRCLLLLLMMFSLGFSFSRAVELAPATNIQATMAAEEVAAETARLFRELRAQQEASQRTIEALKEQAVAAKHSEEVTAARLKLIELTLTERHERELASLQASNRLTLTIVGVVAAVGFFGMILLAIFLMRATSRLAEFPAAFVPALGAGQGPRGLLAGTTTVEANSQLLKVVGLLEQKFRDLEQSLGQRAPGNGAAGSPPEGPVAASAGLPDGGRVAQLLARGQDLLSQDKAEEALVCFEEAASLDPNATEPLVRRGKALEKLGRMEEALKSYDRALALDASLTIAYLGKGGVFNRLERFGEALECYERALRTQSSAATAEAAKG